jgi:hypothetical protein|tara:strand:+ start:2384 stop:4570 length:2187 start_codon:yes stop_codon:yes gene_type:complete
MAKGKPLTETEVAAILQSEIHSSLGYIGSDITNQRQKSLEYYFGEPFGNEQEGRSQVVSTDVSDVIESILPTLLRTFAASDDVVRCDPVSAEDEEVAKQATDYLNYVFNKDNDGFVALYTLFKDALIQKNGIAKVYWDTSEKREQETYEKLSDDEYTMLLDEEDIEVKEHSEYADQKAIDAKQTMMEQTNDPMMMQQLEDAPTPMLHDVVLIRKETYGKVKIETIPPEEFLIERRAKNLQEANFLAHRTTQTRSDLIEAGFDADTVNALPTDTADKYNEEKVSRYRNLDYDFSSNSGEASTDEITVYECYAKIDAEGDGIAKLRKITLAGTGAYQVLDDELCDSIPFVSITPIMVPHRFFGRSVSEMTEDLQLIKSTVMRQLLDNMYLTNNNRVAVMDGQVNLDDLLTNRPGGVVRTKGSPGQVMMPMQTQTINQQAFPLLEYLDTVREQRTGITRYSQGMDADSLNKTATGVNVILTQAQMRVELIARIFAETGVKDMFHKIFELVVKHQDKERIIKIRNTFVPFRPMEWRNRCNVSINVGLGTGSRDQQLSILNNILQTQLKALELQGTPAGPMVNLRNIYNTLSKIVENAGLKNTGLFFTDPDVGMQQMPPPQPPQPTEFEKVSQLQVQGENMRKQMDSEIRIKELEKSYQEMILKFETRIKELELQYGTKINEAEIRRDAVLAREDLVQQGKIREQAQKTVDRQLDQTQQIIQNVTNGSQQTGE